MQITTPMIRLLGGGGDTAEVLRECNEILAADKEQAADKAIFFLRGLAHALRDENDDAVDNFTRFINKIETDNTTDNTEETEHKNALGFAHRFRAQAYERLADDELALQDLYTAIACYDETNPDHKDVIADLRQRIQSVNLKIVNDAIAAQPTIADAFDELANGNLEAVLDISETFCQAEAQEDEDYVKALFLRGLARDLIGRRSTKADEAASMAAKGDFQKAILDYSGVIEYADPEFHFLITAHARRAQLYISLGEASAAEDDLSIVLEREPQNHRARLHKGIASMQQRYYNNAITDCEWVLANEPNNARALDLLGQAALFVFQYDIALDSFQKARQHAQDRPTILRLKLFEALTHSIKKNHTDALALMQDIQPQLMDLPDNELRELQPKFDLLQGQLPLPPEPASPEEEEEEKKRIETERQIFESQAPAEERVKAGIIFLFLWVISRTRTRSASPQSSRVGNLSL